MAIKYRLKFNNFDLKDVIVTLESDKYTGAVTDIIGVGGESYSKNVNWGDHPHETHVGTTNASVKVYTDAIDVDSLQMSSDKDWKMRVTVDGVLDFTGFLIPDGIQNTKKGAGNVVQLNSTCGLALLSGLKFVPNDTIGLVTHDGQVASKYAPIMFFRAILNQLGNTLPIKWSTSIRCDEFPTRDSVAGALEWGTNLNLTTMLEFDNIDSMWMFHELAKSLKLWVCQDGDSWSFINKEDEVRLDGILPVSRIDDGLGAVTSTTASVDFKQNLNGSQLFDDAYTYYKPAIGKSRVYYNHVQDENILPNGGFDYVDNNKPVGWSFKNGTPAQLKSYPSIIERAGRAASLELLAQPNNTVEDIFSLDYPMNVDANVLFKDMRFGFTVLPMDGFATDNEGYISWGQFPLKMSMKYSIIRDGVLSDYYLNEFGYWSDKNIPPNQEIVSATIQKEGTPYILRIQFNATKSFFPGDRFNVTFMRDGVREFYTHVFTETIDVEGGIDILESIIPNSFNPPAPVANFGISGVDNNPNFSVIMDKADNYYKYIYPSLDKMKPVTDVGKWEFQTKGNSGFIKMPDPLELYNKDTQAGKLTLEFFVRSGQRYILDDVWMTFNGNQDIYELTTNKDNSFEKFDMGVSSSFSGFMLSSYMNNYGNANKMMNFTDYSSTGKRLTELYGRGIMNWRYTPRMMYQGSFKVNSFSPFALVSVGGKNYIPLTYDYNINKGQLVGVKLFEARIESPTIEVGHNNFKDKDGTNYGNSSGGEGTLDLEQDLQAVTDVGAITNRVITVGGIRTGDLLSVPTHSPDVQLIVNGEAYAWVGDGVTAGTPSGGGTLGELSDVVLTGLQNGQTITWDSALQMWKNSDGAGGGRWGEITGNITSQTDLMGQLNGKANADGSNASGTWPINVTGDAHTWNGAVRHNTIISTGYNIEGLYSKLPGNLNSYPINAIGLREFLGSPANGETLQSITDRAWVSTNPIRVDQLQLMYSDEFTYNGIRRSNEIETEYWNEISASGIKHRFTGFGNTTLMTIGSNGDISATGVISATGGNSTQWNTAYTHSQSTGNPHQTTWAQLLNKPAIDVNATPNTVVQRDGSGYIEAVYFRDTNKDLIGFSSGINYIYGGHTDGYFYKYNKQAVNQFLGMPANGDTLQSVYNRGNIVNVSAGVDGYILFLSDGKSGGVGYKSTFGAYILCNGSPSIFAHNNGFVGVGQGEFTPTAQLDVRGGIQSNSLITAPQAQITQSLRIPTARPASPQNGDIWIQ